MTRSPAQPRSYKVGERGTNRVRLAADPRRGGRLFVEFREHDGRKVRQYLPHRDWSRAKAYAEKLAAAHRAEPAYRARPTTLRALFDIYLREVTPNKAQGTQQHDRAAAALFLSAWGAARKPGTIGLRDWQRFIVERRSGRITPTGPRGRVPGRGVRDRQVAYDLKWVRAVFRWATLAGDGEGGALVDRDPTAGFPLPSESSPRRPLMSDDRYQAMLAVAPVIHPAFHLALVLAHETGHRLFSIRQLWWSDIRWDVKEIRWRSETDKEGNAHETPLSAGALDSLRSARSAGPAVGEVYLFPDPRRPGVPRSRSSFAKWWGAAEEKAGLVHDERWGWHSLRRKFA